MSKSFLHTPKVKIAGESNKADKIAANRRFRHACRQALLKGKIMPLIREISDVYCFAGDGLARFIHKKSRWNQEEMTDEELNKYLRK